MRAKFQIGIDASAYLKFLLDITSILRHIGGVEGKRPDERKDDEDRGEGGHWVMVYLPLPACAITALPEALLNGPWPGNPTAVLLGFAAYLAVFTWWLWRYEILSWPFVAGASLSLTMGSFPDFFAALIAGGSPANLTW